MPVSEILYTLAALAAVCSKEVEEVLLHFFVSVRCVSACAST